MWSFWKFWWHIIQFSCSDGKSVDRHPSIRVRQFLNLQSCQGLIPYLSCHQREAHLLWRARSLHWSTSSHRDFLRYNRLRQRHRQRIELSFGCRFLGIPNQHQLDLEDPSLAFLHFYIRRIYFGQYRRLFVGQSQHPGIFLCFSLERSSVYGLGKLNLL